MPCPLDDNSRTQQIDQESVVLSRYVGLRAERKASISSWFHNAVSNINCRPNDSFGPFIDMWMAFNGWATCITGISRRDKLKINILKENVEIQNDFQHAMRSNVALANAVNSFYGFLPIFDAIELDQRNINTNNYGDRRELVLHYFSQLAQNGITRSIFEPPCWKKHCDRGEFIPINWLHILSAIYQVRCNLIHGEKGRQIEMDQAIVHNAYLVLVNFFTFAGYLDR